MTATEVEVAIMSGFSPNSLMEGGGGGKEEEVQTEGVNMVDGEATGEVEEGVATVSSVAASHDDAELVSVRDAMSNMANGVPRRVGLHSWLPGYSAKWA